jgi:hypothetical protein
MVGLLMSGECEMVWNELVLASFNILLQDFPEGTEENNKRKS